MADNHLEVFGHLHVVDGEVDGVVCESEGRATGEAHDAPGLHAHGIRCFEGAQDIRRIAATREGYEQVARRGEDRELGGEDLVVTRVVGQAGGDSGICAERMCADASKASLPSAVEEVICPMVGVRRAPAISAKEDRGFTGSGIRQARGQELAGSLHGWIANSECRAEVIGWGCHDQCRGEERSGFASAAGVDEGFDAKGEKGHGDRSHGELYRGGEWALGCASDEGADFWKSHGEGDGSQQPETRRNVHDVHAGLWKDPGEDPTEKNGGSEEGWDEGGDAL